MTAPDHSVASLATALTGTDLEHRKAAAEELAGLGTDARDAAAALVLATSDSADEVREWATAALEQLGPPPTAQRSSLVTALANPTAEVAYWSATLLGRMEAAAAPAVGPLTTLLDSAAGPAACQRAAWALGKIGPAAAAAVESLERAASGSDPRLARLAREALQTIRG
jgi:hypothetical protein